MLQALQISRARRRDSAVDPGKLEQRYASMVAGQAQRAAQFMGTDPVVKALREAAATLEREDLGS